MQTVLCICFSIETVRFICVEPHLKYYIAQGQQLLCYNVDWLHVFIISSSNPSCTDPEGDRGSGPPPPLENHKAIGLVINTGLDPMENHKATKPAFNVGPAKRHLNGISLVG